MVDRLTKMTHLAATTTTVSAEGTAKLFEQHVIKLHGWPCDGVSDRDSRFAGKFTRELHRLAGVHSSMSTAFHPQSDGQTERVNRVLEDALRHYVNATHTDWDDWLPMAEFAVNNAYHESIQNNPFMLNYGQHPRIPMQLPKAMQSRVPAALRFTQAQQFQLQRAKACLKAAQDRMRLYADPKRRPVLYEPGQKVMLSIKNLDLVSKSPGTKKLLPLWIGPYEVKEQVGPVACKLILPENMRVHNVFHVSLLKQFHGKKKVPVVPEIMNGQEEYEVESILRHRDLRAGKGRGRKLRRQYLVEWKGYGQEYSSWTPEANLSNSADAIQDYWEAVQARGLEDSENRAALSSNDPAPSVSPRDREQSLSPKRCRKRRKTS